MKLLIIGSSLLTLLTSTLFAHDIVINRNSNLRVESNSNSSVLQLLIPGSEAKLLDIEKKNGYYRVLHRAGVGYIWGRNVIIIQEYDRGHWKHWIDTDSDCQKTRDETLIAESEIPVTFEDERECKVTAGRWTDPYSGKVFTDPRDLDVDHMVPLKNAHRSGGWEFTYKQRKDYANDLDNPEHLIAVDKSLNRSKGAQGPDTWLPPDESYHCQYVRDWESVKQRWVLTISVAEQAAIDTIKDNSCQ